MWNILLRDPWESFPTFFYGSAAWWSPRFFFSSGFLALGSWKGSCASLIAHWFLSHRIEELTCGGMVEQVQEAFGETMTSVVSLCARYPIACANSIGLLCTIPYTRWVRTCHLLSVDYSQCIQLSRRHFFFCFVLSCFLIYKIGFGELERCLLLRIWVPGDPKPFSDVCSHLHTRYSSH